MKTKHFFVMSALAIVGLTSCEKNFYDPSQDQPDKKVTDLIIPDGFDWQMTKATTCNVTSDHSAQLSIYLDEARTQGNLLAKVSVTKGSNINLPLSILKDTKNVYVEYETADGKKAFVVAPVDANGNISFVAPADSKKVTTRADSDFEKNRGVLYYPKVSGGTVMFEDNYPTLGDYDFNDFVARYSAEIETKSIPINGRNTDIVTKIVFTMNVLAIGGVEPYIPCLRLPFHFDTIIKSVKANVAAGDNQAVEMELGIKKDMSPKGNVVFILNGAEKNDHKPEGSQFLNTEKGVEPFIFTKRVTLTITFNEEKNQALLSDLTSNLFDIFLYNPQRSKEIHMLGYGPAFQANGSNDETANSFTYDPEKNDTYKYKEEKGKNLVWAISIPSIDVAHAYERANFCDAYPLFATWAENGGGSDANWYAPKNTNKDHLFQLKK